MAATLHRLVGHLRRWATSSSAEPTDRQLLEGFAARRDEAAFAELVRRHGPMVLGVARRVLHDLHDAEDVFQATFLVLARKAGSVAWQESVAGWLFPVAFRLALKSRAGRQRRRLHEARVSPMSATEPPAPPDGELRSLLDAELSRLPEHYRSVVLLCYLEGKTQAEAARQLGLSPGEVRGRLERARLRLRQRLRRRGLVLSGGAVGAGLTDQAGAAVPAALLDNTTRAAVLFAARQATAGAATPAAVALAQGALNTMLVTKAKALGILLLVVGLLAAGALLLPVPALGDDPARPPAKKTDKEPQAGTKEKPTPKANDRARHCIILWMGGGPSQMDTFDLKPKSDNGGPFKEIDTTVKGMRISEHLPELAKQAEHLAVIRTLTHTDGDHTRATLLMRTGHALDPDTDWPCLGSLLAHELAGKSDLPPYISLTPRTVFNPRAYTHGFLDARFAPLFAGNVPTGQQGKEDEPPEKVLPLEEFQKLDKDRAEAMRKATLAAFDLSEEKEAVRDAYGRNAFGQGCLIARRLVERGAPVVEVTLGGWDTHANNFDIVKARCAVLDPAWATLLKELKERRRLDRTVVVWMGEFGRTPRINQNKGRDHWPRCFSVVLAGGRIFGGQVIGVTSANGTDIVEQPVTPAELYATIFRALDIDPAKEIAAGKDRRVPLVEKGTRPVQEALK
jgi:RNA polymerase sigma factor (sigma-70 family)